MLCLLLHNGLCMDAVVVRIVAALVAVGLLACANAGEPRLAGAGDAGPDVSTIDACTPAPERCNDLDDDCDQLTDETFTTKGMACVSGIGACAVDGHFVCNPAGTAVTCDAQQGAPTSETCDGLDNDCDGHVDEDFHIGMPCDGPDADVCADGVFTCTSLTASACNDGPDNAGEICDGNDNDCDGHTDEGFNLGTPCDGADTDACNEGTIVCAAGGGTKCSDLTANSVELCNGVDDDCRNGIDDPFPVGQACQVGLGSCLRSGSMMCNGTGSGVLCSATAGAPLAELCGNGADEDCNGADAVCPTNDLASGAIDISAGGTFTMDLTAAHDDNWASAAGQDCGDQGGRDVFYQFTLPAPEVVYFDTFGSNFDSVVRVFAGSCAAIGAVQRCEDDGCSTTRSHGALELPAGSYCLVVDQFSSATTAGAASLVFKRGGRGGVALTGASGSVSGTTTGKTDLSVAGCEANSHQPDVGHFFASCPGSNLVSANTCSATAFDAILSLRTGAASSADLTCSDDVSGCGNGLQPKVVNASVSGANLVWLIVDGFGTTGNGAYTLSYSIQ